jgi:hypothetical protein
LIPMMIRITESLWIISLKPESWAADIKQRSRLAHWINEIFYIER